MTDPRTCPHEDSEPVYAYLSHGPLLLANDAKPVARICTACYEQLPVGWGCPDCDFDQVEERVLCEPQATVLTILRRPCQEHA